jgi:hypothetical protein
LLQGKMKLRAKVIVATQQWFATMWAFALAASARPKVVLFKFVMSEDCQAALWRRKGLVGTKLGLDEDPTLAQ